MSSELFPRLKSRYKDAFNIAGVIVGVGVAFKVIGVILGILIVLIAIVAGSDGRGGASIGLVGGSIVGVVVGAFFYVIGTIVSSQGQILQATLDSAVNTSPHINNSEKAEIMSLVAHTAYEQPTSQTTS